jgi:hypothetical protein
MGRAFFLSHSAHHTSGQASSHRRENFRRIRDCRTPRRKVSGNECHHTQQNDDSEIDLDIEGLDLEQNSHKHTVRP